MIDMFLSSYMLVGFGFWLGTEERSLTLTNLTYMILCMFGWPFFL